MKLNLTYLTLLTMLIFSSGCGTLTDELTRACVQHDPPIDKLHNVYWKNNIIALDYSVIELSYSGQKIESETYWAKIKYSPINKVKIKLYRKPLPENIKEEWNTFEFINSEKSFVWDNKEQMTAQTLPKISYDQDYLIMRYDINNKSSTKQIRLRDSYMTFSDYSKLIILYPFAVIGDVITYPLVMVSPRFP